MTHTVETGAAWDDDGLPLPGRVVLQGTTRRTDTTAHPYRVTVSPEGTGSTEYGAVFAPPKSTPTAIDRVVVTGGKRWVPQWDPTEADFTGPDRVDVYLRGVNRPQTHLAPLDNVSIYGGTRLMAQRARVLGSALDAAVNYLDVLGAADYGSQASPTNALKKAVQPAKPPSVEVGIRVVEATYSLVELAQQVAAARKIPGDTTRQNALAEANAWARTLRGQDYHRQMTTAEWERTRALAFGAVGTVGGVLEGVAYQGQITGLDRLWQDVEDSAAAFAKNVAAAAGTAGTAVWDAVRNPVTTLTGLPLWGWAVVGVGGVGLLGYLALRLLGSSAAHAAAVNVGVARMSGGAGG